MTHAELKTARCTMGVSASEMARALQTPLRTYQDWESGVNRIPGVVAVAVSLLGERMSWSMTVITQNLDNKVAQAYENGARW